MIHASTFEYLDDLGAHDTKDWFDAHRTRYNAVLQNLADVAEAIIAEVGATDLPFAQANPDPRATISRIHRDMRFAKDGRSKYKTDFFLIFKAPPTSIAGYYLHVERDNVYAGGGAFTPQPGELDRIRQSIQQGYDRWLAVVGSPDMTRTFPDGLTSPETLKIAPKGYDPRDPAIEYLRRKGFCANHALSMAQIQRTDALADITHTFATVRPLVEYLNAATKPA